MKGLRVDNLTIAVHTVKILAVDLRALSLDAVIDLMRCFPCLEKLYIEVIIFFVTVHIIQCLFYRHTFLKWLVLNSLYSCSVYRTRENQLMASEAPRFYKIF